MMLGEVVIHEVISGESSSEVQIQYKVDYIG